MSDDKLLQDAQRLCKEIPPERDLWPGIEAVIGTPARPRWTRALTQAAAVVLLVGASASVTYMVTKPDESAPTVLPVVTEFNIQQAAFGPEFELSVGYKLARGKLQSQLDVKLEQLSPDARAAVEQNLEVIRDAIAEINAALELEPDNALLQELLMNTYREELAVMQQVDGLARNVMLRNDI